MKICLYSSVFLPRIGGMEMASLSLATGFVQLGHDVVVCVETPAPAGYDDQFQFRVIRSAQRQQWPQILADRDILVSNAHSLKHIAQWLRSGVPFGWIHGMLLGERFRVSPTSFFRRHFRSWTTHLGSFNICVSEAMKRHIYNRKAVVIPNPIDSIFRPMPDTPTTSRFLYFGRMWAQKGMDTLIEAIAICRQRGIDLPVDFYGEGSDLAATQEMAQCLGVNDLTAFWPFARGEQLVSAINRSLAVVVPSKWDEPFGLTAAEAMACGKCVIGTNRGGLGEVLNGYCPTFDNGNASQLADILADIASHPEKRIGYEQAAIVRARDFERLTVCRQYIDLFQKVIAKKA